MNTLEQLNEIKIAITDLEDDLVWHSVYTHLNKSQYKHFKLSFEQINKLIDKLAQDFDVVYAPFVSEPNDKEV